MGNRLSEGLEDAGRVCFVERITTNSRQRALEP